MKNYTCNGAIKEGKKTSGLHFVGLQAAGWGTIKGGVLTNFPVGESGI